MLEKYHKTWVTEKLPAVGEVLSLVYKLGRRNYQHVTKVRLKCNISQVLKLWFTSQKVFIINTVMKTCTYVYVHVRTHTHTYMHSIFTGNWKWCKYVSYLTLLWLTFNTFWWLLHIPQILSVVTTQNRLYTCSSFSYTVQSSTPTTCCGHNGIKDTWEYN